MLQIAPSSKSKLSVLKNRGGLIFASDDVYLTCLLTEKVFRQNKSVLKSRYINFRIVTETVKILPPRVFDDVEHMLDQEPLYDHRHQSIDLIIQNYVHKRLKHESEKLNDLKSRVCMFYNKLTIFKGQ